MTKGFTRFLIFFIFFLCASGYLFARPQHSSSSYFHAKKNKESSQSITSAFAQKQAVLSSSPSPGHEKPDNRLIANEHEIQEEESLTSRKELTRIYSSEAVPARIFQYLSGSFKGIFAAFNNVPYNLSHKVFLVIQVFRI